MKWDRDTFLAALTERRDALSAALASQVLSWAETHAPQLWWGAGRKDGSCYAGIRHKGKNHYSFSLWTYGRVEIPFQWRRRDVPREVIEGYAERLNRIPGLALAPEALSKRPTFDLLLLKDRASLQLFYEAIEWFHRQIQAG